MFRMIKEAYLFPVFILFAVLSSWATQQTAEPLFPVKQYTLKNGLKIILSEDDSLPIVSVVVAYHVGSTHEEPGKTGLAHLLENLMFQGSRNIGRMQHYSFIQKIGGSLNAITTADKTLFYQTIPSNQLALVLWLESDRMNSLDISPINVENTKKDIIENIQLRKEYDPYLENSWDFDRLLFSNFAYSHPVLGSPQDIRNITRQDVSAFFAKYYSPSNAVLTIVGNFDEQKAMQLIQRYFSTIPMRAIPPSVDLGNLPKIKNTEREVENPMASSPGFYLGYQLAPRDSEDHYRLAITEYALMKGRTSRIFKRLIEKDKTAISIAGGIETRRGQSVFKIFVKANNEIMNERNQRAVIAEINKIKSSYISEEELRKIRNMFKMDYLRQFTTVLDKAIFLTEELLDRGNHTQGMDELDRYLAVTHFNVSRVANIYFKEDKVLLKIKTK